MELIAAATDTRFRIAAGAKVDAHAQPAATSGAILTFVVAAAAAALHCQLEGRRCRVECLGASPVTLLLLPALTVCSQSQLLLRFICVVAALAVFVGTLLALVSGMSHMPFARPGKVLCASVLPRAVVTRKITHGTQCKPFFFGPSSPFSTSIMLA